MAPVINRFFDSNFEISSILNIGEYTKEMETYQVDSKNTGMNKVNEDSIKQIYLSNLKNDIESKLKEKNYQVNHIELEIEDGPNYEIKKMVLSLEKQQKEEETKENTKVVVNEIEKVEVQIGNTEKSIKEPKSTLTEQEKKEIKQYLTAIYETKENQITIY